MINTRIFIVLFVVSAVAGILGGIFADVLFSKSEHKLIKEFYEIENAVYVSPHSIRKHMGDDSIVLVDLRSMEEYETAHIVGAVSIPAYKNPNESAYGDTERIVNKFQNLIAKDTDRDIVVYCYSMPCMTGRKVGQMLAEHGIYVKHLGIGWQEWRYYWNLWNHDGEDQVDPADYIASGFEPGIFTGKGGRACPIGGDFGC
ncbi:MAG: rhodanese-like domain-containing protein [Parcubacteria group bacterium]|nr:rhodanese-like domain-containing protein [Parcubacteria group bacterium]